MQKNGSKIINVKRPENRAHKCDYSCKPSRLLELPISAIRIVHFDYSHKPSRLLALTNDIKKKPRSRGPGTSVCDKKLSL